ncbi:GAF domain-containing protein [Sulfurovum sp. XGS-02]|uniref:GAF domain-containing protein n=1 Tax=Sulfurovum sp. XGS-02 TaxID=2925411 RepID=UPI00205E40FB|nr:GAF domain-containing protein [Sulfurovum sp. XGS-02]UPT78312.1 GAF domain-containing protein [Sulfurovum sp. XGS-02]
MQGDVKSNLKTMANTLNKYVESKDLNEIEKIENQFEALFNAEVVKLWAYDDKNETLQLIENGNQEAVSLLPSLTKQAITDKSSVISNHSTSDKYYTPEIDNPLELKVKALMIFPIIKGQQVIGVLRIWRGLKQKKIFTRKDESILKSFMPILIKLIVCEKMEKEEIIVLTDDTTENKVVTDTKPAATPKAKDLPSKVSDEFTALQKKLDETLEELESYRKNEAVYKIQIDKSQSELKKSKENCKQIETSALELSSEIEAYQSQINELTTQLEILKEDHEHVKHALKEANKNNNVQNIKEEKLKRSLIENKRLGKLDQNIELILDEVYHLFEKNEYSYMLFELLVFSISSKKGMDYLEETLRKTKLVPDMIEGYYFNGNLKVHNEKCLIQDFIKRIEKYKNNIFPEMMDFNVVVENEVPASLVFDAPKIQTILLHLLMDLNQFAEHSKPVNIHFAYKNKFLTIEIGTSVYQKNSLLKSVLKQIKLTGNEKERHGLQLSIKLIKRLKGEIESVYEDEYYKFVFSVPAQVIKI